MHKTLLNFNINEVNVIREELEGGPQRYWMTHIVKYINTRLLPKDKKEELRIKKEIMFILVHERPVILTRIRQSSIKMFNKEKRKRSFRGNSQKLNITTPR